MFGPQYNPYAYGMASPYQQRLSQLEQPIYQQPVQQAPPMQQNPQMLKGRVVASVDEARAAQVDLDGSVTYFASPGEGKIYAKSIGMNGLPVFTVYVAQTEQANTVPNNNLESLTARVQKLEEAMKDATTRNAPTSNAQ